MGKVLLLSTSDSRHMPMSVFYTNYFEKNNIPYDIIRINRYDNRDSNLIKETDFGKIYEYNGVLPMDSSFLRKMKMFFAFGRYAKKIIKKEKYDYIVVWNENTAGVFSAFLSVCYKGRYCINIRDYYSDLWYAKIPVFFANLNSDFIMEPTPGLVKGFPDKTFLVYNRDIRLVKDYIPHPFHGPEKPIRITHLGFYSKTELDAKQIVDILGNDERFIICFYGQGFESEFQEYITMKGYKNVITGGAFPYEDTYKYLEMTDIINVYYNHEKHLEFAFGIKNSYTPLLYIPGITSSKTHWASISKEYGGLAFLVDDSNIISLADDLYEWYMGLDYSSFVEGCKRFNKEIDQTQRKVEDRLTASLRKISYTAS